MTNGQAGAEPATLAEIEARNSPEGLFRRYAEGRLRHFANRQVLGLLGAVVAGLTLSPGVGLAVAVLVLVGETMDCLLLRHLLGLLARGGLGKAQMRLAGASAAIQTLFLGLALTLCARSAQEAEIHVFIAAFVTGIAINTAVVRPYFRLGTDLRLAVLVIGALALWQEHIRLHGGNPQADFLWTAALMMLALSVTMFTRHMMRGFHSRLATEKAMARKARALAMAQADLARAGKLNQRLALAARHANDAIVFLDPDDRYEWVNDAFMRITGYTATEALGRRPGALLNGVETSAETIAKLDQARRDRQPIRVEIFNRGKGGRGFWVDTSIIPIFDDEGCHVTTLAIEREITEAKAREAELARAREAAEAAAQAKARFLANMSHEIRTPLNGVMGVADLLVETPLTYEQRDYVETIRDSGRALLQMVDDVLDLARLQSGKLTVEDRVFDLHRMVGRVQRLMRPAAEAKGLALPAATIAAEVPAFVRGDEGKLRQILVNLLGNAIKFTESGQVHLSLAADPGGGVSLAVQDSGIGIAPDRIATIFDSFTQADDSISRRFGGTGLGLTISAMLADRMGGTIAVASELGKGSSFTLSMPLPAADPPLSEAPAARAAPAALPLRPRLLLAEDNRTNMMILRRFLQDHAEALIEATNGREALAARFDEAPDLIVMDVSMPEMDGLAAARAIRAQEGARGLPRLPILALTAASQAEDREACLAAGFDGFLVKPLRREELLSAIAAQLSAPPQDRRAAG